MKDLVRLVYESTLADGGCTLILYRELGIEGYSMNPNYGFVVGGLVEEQSCNPLEFSEFEEMFNSFVERAYTDLQLPYLCGVGTWIEDGKCVFDIVELTDADSVMGVAKARGERAVWDCENQKEIAVL